MRGLTVLLLSASLAPPLAAEGAGDGFFVAGAEDGIHEYVYTLASRSDGRERELEPALAWACDEDGLNVFHVFGAYLAGDDERTVRVRYRFGDAPTGDGEAEDGWLDADTGERWQLAHDSRSAWMPLDGVHEFTRDALGHGSVSIRVTDPLDDESLTDRFELDGLVDALSYLPCR